MEINSTMLAILVAPLLASCAGSDAKGAATRSGGTLVIATTADPDELFPLLPGNTQARAVTELLYDYLAEIGTDLNIIGDAGFRPQLADSWRWAPDSLSIAFHINPAARWHDGVPVRASDVRFTYELAVGPALGRPMRDAMSNIDSVTTRYSQTATFWFHARRPDQFYTVAGLMLILPQHVFGKFSGDSASRIAEQIAPVGSGRFRFAGRKRGESLEIRADRHNYRGRPSLDRVVWSVAPEFQTAVTRLVGGEADLFDALHADNLPAVRRNADLQIVTLPGMDYVFMQFNLRDPAMRARPHPVFADRELRRALTMAIDRQSMVRSVFDTLALPSIGPTISALPSARGGLTQIPYDTVRAARLLDSLGWKRGADGVRARAGRLLSFKLLVPSSSLARVRFAVLIQAQLILAGVKMDIEQMDFAAFRARQDARSFDAALGAWHVTGNPSAIVETWSGDAVRRRDGRNYGSYESPSFDAALDSAIAARDTASSNRLYNRAYQTILDDAPAVWLYEPRTVIGLHRRFKTVGMRPDAWWARLGEWWIPPRERIARDAAQPKG